jgi:hypothetical protein
MNKYLMMTAAALLASTAAANAGERHFKFGTMGGGSYCDGGIGIWSSYVYGWQHTNYDCAGSVALGTPGIEGKTSGIGKNINMSDASFFSNNYSGPICSYDFPPKFKIGGTWSLWCSFSGSLAIELNSGILLPSNAKAQGSKSTLAAVKAVVAERRSQRERAPVR